jgi:hypothetical protein
LFEILLRGFLKQFQVKDLYKNVNELLPQLGRRWGVLCCRVTQKSEFIPSANGSYLILTVADLTGEIRVKIFGSAAKRLIYTLKSMLVAKL